MRRALPFLILSAPVLETTSITNGAVDPAVGTDPAVAADIDRQAVEPKPKLVRMAVSPRRITRATRVLSLTFELSGNGDRVRARVFKRGRRKALRTTKPRTVDVQGRRASRSSCRGFRPGPTACG